LISNEAVSAVANQEHFDLLKRGVDTWNQWRKYHPEVQPDLSGAILSYANLSRTDLSRSNLSGTYLSFAYLREANLCNADLSGAYLREANLCNADLSGAYLIGAVFIRTDLTLACLTGCRVYGISAWDVRLEKAMQENLVITLDDQSTITVDDLEIAQFIYLLLNNKKIRAVIDAIASKVVLLLGRFTSERKVVLNAMKDELRKHNYSPVLFDFEKPASRDLTETVSILAHLARFIIVDLTDPSSAPHEVATLIPQCVVPVQPLLSGGPLVAKGKVVERREYAMFEDLRRRYPWVLPTVRYKDIAELIASFKEQIIDPAEQKAKELAKQE
jgi:hypothetical protein